MGSKGGGGVTGCGQDVEGGQHRVQLSPSSACTGSAASWLAVRHGCDARLLHMTQPCLTCSRAKKEI